MIGCLKQLLVAPEDPAAVVERIAAPATAIVSLTVTEKGYCHDPASGQLDWTHADIRHDVALPLRPRSAVGMLVAGLARRREGRIAPPTVLSCDNLPANGSTLRGLVIALAARHDEALARWIEAEVAFPCSMVDRIVPATTAADVAQIGRALGAARCRAGGVRALPAMGDRGPLRRAAAGLGAGGRRAGRRGRAL